MADTPMNTGSLENFFKYKTSLGPIESSLTNNLYGINSSKMTPKIDSNKDLYGYVFFTRPQLNLTTMNIRRDRELYNLLTNNNDSLQAFIRTTLDPRLQYTQVTNVKSTLTDKNNVFIPILTNTVKSVSGWPDVVIPTFDSREGVRKEQMSMVDGVTQIYNAFDLDVTFRNIINEPVIMLFQTWLKYMGNVFEGIMDPYIDFITENELDYNTRIYRVITDVDNKKVKKISCTGASFPLNVPLGNFFDYNSEVPISDANRDITIRFKCNGAMYNDDIIIDSFNKAVGIFNPDMRGEFYNGSEEMEKIPDNLKNALRHRGYPYINPNTYELEWYAKKEVVVNFLKQFNKDVPEEMKVENLISDIQTDLTQTIV